MPRLRRRRLPDGVLEICKDYAGRTVLITETNWKHVLAGHPEMDGLQLAVKTALERADHKAAGNRPGSEKISGANLGPSRWLVVVVAYDAQGLGRVLTAYPSKKDPG